MIQSEVRRLLDVANGNPARIEEIDVLLDIVSRKGLNELTETQRIRLGQLSSQCIDR
jgi:hypothetical protein